MSLRIAVFAARTGWLATTDHPRPGNAPWPRVR
jgi:hypothetical protein